MFVLRLIRLAFLLMLAFVAGMFTERGHHIRACDDRGGIWADATCKRAGDV
ncbi:MAG: hypothetical protein Q4G25_12980 [Paracoccus sp. (in: a-proteobacteria)]|nr:hypothetical protein [Paracoccus sp. (in: a-proteobacteria)]